MPQTSGALVYLDNSPTNVTDDIAISTRSSASRSFSEMFAAAAAFANVWAGTVFDRSPQNSSADQGTSSGKTDYGGLSTSASALATAAAANLKATNSLLQKSIQRLSSGSRIINSSDDAGSLSMSMRMGASVRRAGATGANILNALSFLNTQDGALRTAAKVFDRMSELATLSQDPIKTNSDTSSYQSEFSSLQLQVWSLAEEKFNGLRLFGATDAAPMHVMTSEDGVASSDISIAPLVTDSSVAAAIDAANVIDGGLENAVSAGRLVIEAIDAIARMRAKNGVEANRLEFSWNLLSLNKQNMELAHSRIFDVDIAAESAQLARYSILQKSGTAMLLQANQSTRSVLNLVPLGSSAPSR